MTLMSRTQNKTISLSTGRRIKNFSLSYWHNTAGLNGLYKNVERYTRDRRPGRSSGQKAKNTIKYNKDKIPVLCRATPPPAPLSRLLASSLLVSKRTASRRATAPAAPPRPRHEQKAQTSPRAPLP